MDEGADIHVELRAVSKRFGGIRALDGVPFRVVRGSIHAVVGENGAGKSTLGKVIAGAISPDSGEVLVDGKNVHFRSPHDAIAAGITIIAQELALEPQRSVLENVFLGVEDRRFGVIDRGRLRRRYNELSDRVGFDLAPQATVGALRLADQQKVEILRAVARDAHVIVMDEPTAALSAGEAQRLFATIGSLRAAGTTIVYVSHFLSEVLALVDTVTVLRDGRHVLTSPAATQTPRTLVAAMLGRDAEVAFPPKCYPDPGAAVVCSVRGLSRPGAFEDVSFDVRGGEIVGLAGLMGSGRTEVARAIFGADRFTSGYVEIEGKPVRIRHPRHAIAAGIAMIPESRKAQGLLMRRSIVENITLPHLGDVAPRRTIPIRRERQKANATMRRLDVRAQSANARVAGLSGGNQQKVLFAKWMFRQPRLFIADEPTRGIDVGAKRVIYELLAGLAADGLAVLLISSEIEEVLGLAHSVLVMRSGRIVDRFEGSDVAEDAVMHAAFGTRVDAW